MSVVASPEEIVRNDFPCSNVSEKFPALDDKILDERSKQPEQMELLTQDF